MNLYIEGSADHHFVGEVYENISALEIIEITNRIMFITIGRLKVATSS